MRTDKHACLCFRIYKESNLVALSLMLLVYLARLVLVADVRNVAAQSRTCSHIAYIQNRSPGDWNAAGNRLAMIICS